MDEIIAWLGRSSEWSAGEVALWYGGWLYVSLLVLIAGRDIHFPVITPAWNALRNVISKPIDALDRKTRRKRPSRRSDAVEHERRALSAGWRKACTLPNA